MWIYLAFIKSGSHRSKGSPLISFLLNKHCRVIGGHSAVMKFTILSCCFMYFFHKKWIISCWFILESDYKDGSGVCIKLYNLSTLLNKYVASSQLQLQPTWQLSCDCHYCGLHWELPKYEGMDYWWQWIDEWHVLTSLLSIILHTMIVTYLRFNIVQVLLTIKCDRFGSCLVRLDEMRAI